MEESISPGPDEIFGDEVIKQAIRRIAAELHIIGDRMKEGASWSYPDFAVIGCTIHYNDPYEMCAILGLEIYIPPFDEYTLEERTESFARVRESVETVQVPMQALSFTAPCDTPIPQEPGDQRCCKSNSDPGKGYAWKRRSGTNRWYCMPATTCPG